MYTESIEPFTGAIVAVVVIIAWAVVEFRKAGRKPCESCPTNPEIG